MQIFRGKENFSFSLNKLFFLCSNASACVLNFPHYHHKQKLTGMNFKFLILRLNSNLAIESAWLENLRRLREWERDRLQQHRFTQNTCKKLFSFLFRFTQQETYKKLHKPKAFTWINFWYLLAFITFHKWDNKGPHHQKQREKKEEEELYIWFTHTLCNLSS